MSENQNHSRKVSYPRFISRGAKKPGKLYSTAAFAERVREITADLGLEEGTDWHLYDEGRRVNFSPSGDFDSEGLKHKIENSPELFPLSIC